MQYLQFSIYDKTARLFGKPFLCNNVSLSYRICAQLLKDKANDLSRTPGDFTLFVIGSFDESTGTISSVDFDDFKGDVIDEFISDDDRNMSLNFSNIHLVGSFSVIAEDLKKDLERNV